jgi:DNA-binding transcriptional MocR family regulator
MEQRHTVSFVPVTDQTGTEVTKAGYHSYVTRYEQIADHISAQIREGLLRAGEQIPSVRKARRAFRASPATVLQAYRLLESRGLAQARPRSGYYVSPRWSGMPEEPKASRPPKKSAYLDVSELVFEVLRSIKDRSLVQLGSAFIDPTHFPLAKLARYLGTEARRIDPDHLVEYLPPGQLDLRKSIARRYLESGIHARPDDIVVTSGGLEALSLCLGAVARPGDVIAIESPAFYAALQAIESKGMKAVEIATHPREGIELGELSTALAKHAVKACWIMTNFQNPLGSLMPEDKKKELVKLLARHDIPLIEDDVYEELYFSADKPRPAKSFDRKGLVLHCSSFSKCVGPGYRVGWALAGSFGGRVERAKWMTTLMTNAPGQAGLAAYVRHGAYDHHLRGLRRKLQEERDLMLLAIQRYFPVQTKVTRPEGGYFLWVELPESVDALKLTNQAIDAGITIAPGPIFSAQRKFRNCIRLNYGQPWSPRLEKALASLGNLISSSD